MLLKYLLIIIVSNWSIRKSEQKEAYIDLKETIVARVLRDRFEYECSVTILSRNYALTTRRCAAVTGKT